MSETIPITMGVNGAQPQMPQALLAQLLALVQAFNPGYTANLPGILIEDVSSTDVNAIALCDSFFVELINSITPYGANLFILNQLAAMLGVQAGVDTNTNVYVVFSGPAGWPITQGFIVGDGTYQYVIQDGGVIGTGGASLPLFAVATIPGVWAVPPNTVNQFVTSVPSSIDVTFTNPLAGNPSTGPQSTEDFRAQVLQANLAASQGMTRYLKTLLQNVPGVTSRLISVRQPLTNQWEIIVGGGDPYQVANAIFQGLFDISTLVGSIMSITNITNANPGVVTTLLNYGLPDGTVINIADVVGMTPVNNTPLTITGITEKTFSIGIDTSSYPAYVSGGVITPNPRNQVIDIYDYPDLYAIPFVTPPLQTVAITLTWNTNSSNPVSATAMAQAGAPALVAYVNSIAAGQPMNLFELQNAFQLATANILPTQLLTRMVFSVSINGVPISPSAGTGIIAGDPESYFDTDATQITIVQG